MSLLPARPNSLCLLCASAARSRLLQPQRLLPRTQVAHRAGGQRSKKKREHLPNDPVLVPLSSRSRLNLPKTYGGGYFDPALGSRPPKPRPRPVPGRFFNSLRLHLDKLGEKLEEPKSLESLLLNRDEFDVQWLGFERRVNLWVKQAPPDLTAMVNDTSRQQRSLTTHLRQMFYAQVYESRFTRAELENQNKVADLRYPTEWFPATREIPRTVHLHVGPTNSGKTYHALKRLEEAKRGIYLGPLRLLAYEVYTRLNAKGKACALVTGEEQRMPEGQDSTMFSCTVEMAPLNSPFDVAVLDEIQMINHRDRGWAWTQAFLGLQAKEIHLCGEARTVPLMRELCALVGDKVVVHEYQRLTPLKVEPSSLKGDIKKLQKGDCVVAFTVIGLHRLRRDIEKKTGKKCAIVYGSLPPETRAQQAKLFNDPDNDYDFLVASDAIGMGLNLAIKRVIFESTVKHNGTEYIALPIADMKQIAGRAGRYKTAHDAVNKQPEQAAAIAPPINPAVDLDDQPPATDKKKDSEVVGWVTTLSREDHNSLVVGMGNEPEPIKTAGLFPPSIIIERFANYFPPGTPFSYILTRLNEISEIHPRFHICELKDQLTIADAIHSVKNLSIKDRTVICSAPLNLKTPTETIFLQKLAQCIADGSSGSLLDLEVLPLQAMDQNPSRSREYLYGLETLHKMLVCYLWLSFRFPNVFTTRALANYTKQLVEHQIEKTLTEFAYTEGAIDKLKEARAQRRKEMESTLSRKIHAEQIEQPLMTEVQDMPEEAGDLIHHRQTPQQLVA